VGVSRVSGWMGAGSGLAFCVHVRVVCRLILELAGENDWSWCVWE